MGQTRFFSRRNVLAAFCGLAAAVLVVVIGAVVLVRFTYGADQLARIRAGQPGSTEVTEETFDRVVVTSSLGDYVVLPLAAAAAGLAVGLIASSGLVVLAVLSVLPLVGIVLSATTTWQGVGLSLVYATVSYLTSRGVWSWRTRG